jgi:hypothetical protein
VNREDGTFYSTVLTLSENGQKVAFSLQTKSFAMSKPNISQKPTFAVITMPALLKHDWMQVERVTSVAWTYLGSILNLTPSIKVPSRRT